MILWAFLFLLGFGAWELWRLAVTEYTKNHLFDLRDELRAWFLRKGYGLEHPTYRAAREMLNARLWHVSRASYLQYLLLWRASQKYPEWSRQEQERIDRLLNSDNQEINDFIFLLRQRSAYAFGACLMAKSFLVLVFSGFIGLARWAMSFAGVAARVAWKIVRDGLGDFMAPIPRLAGTIFLCASAALFPIKPSTSASYLEAWSANARMAAARGDARGY